MFRHSVLFAALASLATTAASQPPVEPVTITGEQGEVAVHVLYGDLQLRRPIDQLILARRIKGATHKACADIYSSWFDSAGMLCEQAGWRIAKPQLDEAIAASATTIVASSASLTIRLGQ